VTGSYTWARQWVMALPTITTGNIGETNISANTSGVYAGVSTTNSQDFHFDRMDLRVGNVPHALKVLWLYDLPFGRGKHFGTDMNKWLDGVVGGWQFSGDGRVQVQSFRLSNVRLVNMTTSDVAKMFKQIRVTPDPATGVLRVWNMPQDIVDNTRKAYTTDPTSPTGYPTGNVPTGRYFAPASSLGCIAMMPGDCGVPDLYFMSPTFGEFDIKMVKRFPLPGRAQFEFDVEVFNVFRSDNFSPNLNPTAADPFRITAAGSGARTGQLVWRVTW